jgi:hypothetical protein
MIDVANEPLIPFSTAAREAIPGGPVHVSTVWRWSLRGVRGVRLECIMRGGTRFTSRQAITRFLAATTAAASGQTVGARSASREAAIAAAEKELAEVGL